MSTRIEYQLSIEVPKPPNGHYKMRTDYNDVEEYSADENVVSSQPYREHQRP